MKAQMDIAQLTVDQRQVMVWLTERGAVSPSQLLAQTSHAPREVWDMLTQLAEWGLVILREDPDSPDGLLVFAAPTASQALNQSQSA
jgi:hypothetical protein